MLNSCDFYLLSVFLTRLPMINARLIASPPSVLFVNGEFQQGREVETCAVSPPQT